MRLVPWWLLLWACKRFHWCWAQCVSLKLYGLRAFIADGSSLRPSVHCFRGMETGDYCGWYGPEHPCHQEALREPTP